MRHKRKQSLLVSRPSHRIGDIILQPCNNHLNYYQPRSLLLLPKCLLHCAHPDHDNLSVRPQQRHHVLELRAHSRIHQYHLPQSDQASSGWASRMIPSKTGHDARYPSWARSISPSGVQESRKLYHRISKRTKRLDNSRRRQELLPRLER